MNPNAQDDVHDLLNKLQAPVENIGSLLAYLSAPLDNIGLLPPVFRKFNRTPLPRGVVKTSQHIAQFQRTILQHIVPTWDLVLLEKGAKVLLDQYFCPDSISNASQTAGEVAVVAYSTLHTSTLSEFAMRLLEDLAVQYPVDRLYTAATSRTHLEGQAKSERVWADCITNLVNVPAKVANALPITAEGTVLSGLENETFFNRLFVRVEILISSLASGKESTDSLSYVSYLLGRLVSQGLFPPTPPVSRTQPSFFQATLPIIRSKVLSANQTVYFAYWNDLWANLPSTHSLQSIWISLFNSLRRIEQPLEDSAAKRALVREEATLLTNFVGLLQPDKEELWETVTSIVLKRVLDPSSARIFVCWISGAAKGGKIDTVALETFLQGVLELWSDSEYVKHSLLSQHHYVTSLLLLSASYFSVESPPMRELAFNPSFIQGVGRYLSHQDSSVRHCGMLVAEEIARMGGKTLQFGGWDGDDSGKPWARDLRQLIRARDVDADVVKEDSVKSTSNDQDVENEEVISPAVVRTTMGNSSEPSKAKFKARALEHDSDDSLDGYGSPPSSRSASPTPSELAEIEKDPSLNVKLKKVSRPVYLKQLGDLLRGSGAKTGSDDPHEADKIQMALNCAEELIRKKRDYGTELAENAANLEYALLSLHNIYELDDFSEKRQSALNALVSCAPRQAAPALIEEFFKNQYSVDQRYVALNAIALGARDLASLPIPKSRVADKRTAFPSRTLPPVLHKKYIASNKADTNIVPSLVEDIKRKALEEGEKSPESQGKPMLVREKVLRIKRPSGISEDSRGGKLPSIAAPDRPTFTAVAAEYFICPLVNRFWLFLREEQSREERTAHLDGRSKYDGAGTGLILNPLVLSHYLRTLSVLVNASQNAPEWLGIISPDSLELAIAIGTRPMSSGEGKDGDDEEGREGGKEASVISGALELALVVLDGSIAVDGGRSLGLEHTNLLLGANEWALRIFGNLEKGLRVEGGGGVQEARLRSIAAGVLLKVDGITSRWGRSMLDYNLI